MPDIATAGQAHQLLRALAEQLAASGHAYELVVIGGSALLAAGVIDRPTQDVDVLALRSGDTLLSADPLPPELLAARDRVSRDFGVAESWLNAGPTGLLSLGLPGGLIGRLNTGHYGAALTVHFASRLDQIHFKPYAFVDQGPGKHETDLRALEPTRDELIQAARWTRTHDPSPGFAQLLGETLTHLGVEDANLGTW